MSFFKIALQCLASKLELPNKKFQCKGAFFNCQTAKSSLFSVTECDLWVCCHIHSVGYSVDRWNRLNLSNSASPKQLENWICWFGDRSRTPTVAAFSMLQVVSYNIVQSFVRPFVASNVIIQSADLISEHQTYCVPVSRCQIALVAPNAV